LVELEGLDHRSELVHPDLVVQHNQAPCRVRRFHVVTSVSGKMRTLKINNASIDTLKAALLERMYFCVVDGAFVPPPPVDKNHAFATLKGFRNGLLKKLGTKPSKLTPEEFVEMFRGRKKTIYNNALEEFYEKGVLRKHAISAAFVKCEKVNPTKAPRCIQPRHPVYNIGVGCYLKHIEHRIYRSINKMFGEKHVVMKGYNVEEIGEIISDKWSSFARPVGIGLDATKFDMHVSAEMLQWEHSIYLDLYKNDKELRRLLKMQVENKGVGHCDDGKLKYSVRGRRFSGDMNTALGNCLIMCAMVWQYAKEKNIPIKFINNGDDCVVFMEREHELEFVRGLDEWFIKMGFRMTREPSAHNLEDIEFCQMRVLRTSRGNVAVRNFDTAREKDSMCLFPLDNESAMRKWLYAVGECGLALCGGVPVMESFYKCYMRNGIKSNMQDAVHMQSGMRFLAVRMEAKEAPITPDARTSFMMAWGYTPDEQVAMEQYYDQLNIEHTIETIDNYLLYNYSPL